MVGKLDPQERKSDPPKKFLDLTRYFGISNEELNNRCCF